MKYAFISDIHGNAVALDAVVDSLQKENVNQTFVLGDICYRGPEPKRSLDIVRSIATKVIKGNADEWVVRGVKEGEVPSAALEIMNIERDWIRSKLNDDDVTFLQSLDTELHLTMENGQKIHAFHATPTSLFEVVLPKENDDVLLEKLMSKQEASLYLYAHIHLPYVRFFQGKCVANLGSVGLPFDGQPRASYLLVEEDETEFNIKIKRVSYDVERVLKKYEELEYPNVELLSKVVKNGISPF
ncbi:metallophosphoesterase family protein [Bacillus alkalicellulosilyticus]|uniref:metallophosphoesterase family protein n=1 Tax=Alkalihalobacterium alkalicellulosilyticum TaxID=1912214 RepID=UPI00099647BB|nr:metallophosphoesterase family protein [Bacillus alkalicellulosilyticus]